MKVTSPKLFDTIATAALTIAFFIALSQNAQCAPSATAFAIDAKPDDVPALQDTSVTASAIEAKPDEVPALQATSVTASAIEAKPDDVPALQDTSGTASAIEAKSGNLAAPPTGVDASTNEAKPEDLATEKLVPAEIDKVKNSLQANPTDRALRRRLAVLYSQSLTESAKAQPIFEELMKEHEDTDSLMDLASCHYKVDYDETFRLCSKAEKLDDGKEYTKAMVTLAQAGSRYRKNDLKNAERLYLDSVKELTARDPFLVAKLDLAGLAGVYCRMGDYAESAKRYEELYKLDRDAYGADDIECGWALLQECQALTAIKRSDLSIACWNRAIWIFRKSNSDRLIDEYKQSHDGQIAPEMVAHIQALVYGRADTKDPGDPIPSGHCDAYKLVSFDLKDFVTPWKRQFKQTEAPGWVWLDPTIHTKAVLICVHGLGLHHRSFESFARRIAKEGIITVAFDVRGFGTYMETNGQDTLNMDQCVDDLKKISVQLRKDYRDYPMFMLGESMGGALAMRVVAESPDLVDGLICSVPSGQRHNSLGTKIKIGTDYVLDKRKPVPVGLGVIKHATSNLGLRTAWINDPSARLTITPAELLNFQKFMNENATFAKLIKSKPVILFQGHNDKLVKESGTLDLFNALATPDKSMVIVGDTEHLIFESGQFKDDLTLGVLGWMSAHYSRSSPNEKLEQPLTNNPK